MAKQEANKLRPEEERRAVFLALAAAQGVVRSRKGVAEMFGLSDRKVRQIEQEGIDGGSPPLG